MKDGQLKMSDPAVSGHHLFTFRLFLQRFMVALLYNKIRWIFCTGQVATMTMKMVLFNFFYRYSRFLMVKIQIAQHFH